MDVVREHRAALNRLPVLRPRQPAPSVERIVRAHEAWVGVVRPEQGAAEIELTVPSSAAPSDVIVVTALAPDGSRRHGRAPLPSATAPRSRPIRAMRLVSRPGH
jgi:hypothetical protein